MIKTWNLGYQKSKEKAKRIYSKISRIACPAFNGEYIAFNRNGFNHLIRKGRIPRSKNEQKKRFILLPYIEQIIKNPKATILYEKRDFQYKINRYGKKILVTSITNFWTFIEKINSCTIKIVIIQHKNSNKYFLSIMGKNIQTRTKKTKKS